MIAIESSNSLHLMNSCTNLSQTSPQLSSTSSLFGKPPISLNYRSIAKETQNSSFTSSEDYIQLFKQYNTVSHAKNLSASSVSPSIQKQKLIQEQTEQETASFNRKSKPQLSLLKRRNELIFPIHKQFSAIQAFSEHEFTLCKEGLDMPDLMKSENDNIFPVISLAMQSKAISFVEFHRKKGFLSVHLTDKLHQNLQNNLDFIPEESSKDIKIAGFDLNQQILSLRQENKPSLSKEVLDKEIQKQMVKQTKACLTQAYTRNEKGIFQLRGIHISEKFLVYCKWQPDLYMINSLETSIPEVFSGKNYQTIQTSVLNSITSALKKEKSNSSIISAELITSDGGFREITMSSDSTFFENQGLLLVSYLVEKVISERKPQALKQKRKSSKEDIDNRNASTSIESVSTQKRKASSSYTSEEVITSNNEDESLSTQEKHFLQRFYSL